MTIAQGSTGNTARALAERSGQAPQVGKTLQDEIRDLTPQLAAALPPGIITPERFVRTVLTTIRKNAALLNCSRESFLGSMLTAAQLGLEVDPALGQAYLIPYRNECTLQIGYKGYIELAWRGGITMKSNEVREFDHFEFQRGTKPFLDHSYKLGQDRGETIGYYATATFPDSRVEFEVMDLADIEKRKKRSQVRSDKGPWATDPVAMSKKTVIRAMIPQIPLTTELGRALEVDEGIVKVQGAGRELVTSFPDQADIEFDDGDSPALTGATQRSPWRIEQEDELEALMREAARFEDAVAWLMREHGPIPTLDDDRIVLAIAGIKGWLDAPDEEPQVEAPTRRPRTAPVDVQAVSVDSDVEAPAIGQTTVMVAGMKAEKVRETLGLFIREGDGPIPTSVGEQRTRLIEVLVRERQAGNVSALDLF